MLLISEGYQLNFIQTHPINDSTDHLRDYIFKFFSEINKLHYIVKAEHHRHDFFSIKFYAKKDRKSDRKYYNITNKGDVANILITCAKAIPYLLQIFPAASFGFIGSRTIDISSNKVEDYFNNQRFRIYKQHLPQLFGDKTFLHISFDAASAYALINRKNIDIDGYKSKVQSMIINTYNDILELE